MRLIKTPMTVYGYRELKGCLPPHDNPSKFRIYWTRASEKGSHYIFFARAWIKDFEIWAPCDSTVRVITGGSRKNLNDFDRGTDNIHQIITWLGEKDLLISIEIRDHRSFQAFSEEQLNNLEGENTEINVE